MERPRTDATLVLIVAIGALMAAVLLALLAAWNVYAGVAGITLAITFAALLPPN